MTFDAQEISQRGGKPVTLFEFRQSTTLFRYTNAEVDVSGVLAATWTSETITRSEPKRAFQESAEQLSVTVPATNPVAQRFTGIPPAEAIVLTVYEFHRTDLSAQVIQFWKGTVRACNFRRDGMAVLSCKSLLSDQSREIPRFSFSSQCPFELYGGDCNASEVGRRFELTVTSVSGREYTLNGLAAAAAGDPGAFLVGTISTFDEQDHRLIVGQSGDVVTTLLPFESLGVGATAVVRYGCARDILTCNSKFSNGANFGGFAFVPDRNVFETGIE